MMTFKRTLSVLLAVMLLCGALTIAPASAASASYRDNLIDAILNNEKLWKKDYWNGTCYFQDLNFDGNLEFIVTDFGGSMLNVSNDIYYYANGKLVCASSGFKSQATTGVPGYFSLYYNKNTGAMKYLGGWALRNGISEVAVGSYTMAFNGKAVKLAQYRGVFTQRDWRSGNITNEDYYGGRQTVEYGVLAGSKISKTAYNYQDTKVKSGFKEVSSVKCGYIQSYQWSRKTRSSRRSMLEASYDDYSTGLGKFAAPAIKSFQNTNSGIKMTWGKVAGAAKYRVFGYNSSSGWKKLGDTTDTSYLFKTSKSGATYRFTVRCLSADGKEFTSPFNASGWKYMFIGVPKVSKLSNSKNGVVVKFSKTKGASKIRVFRKTGSGKWMKLTDTTATSFVDKTAKNGVKYTYTVRCVSPDGKKFYSGYDAKGISITCRR